MKLVFMGTPFFAIPSLKKLAATYDVKAVVTQPDRPKGRGLKIEPSPVKTAALELGLRVLQPSTLKNMDFVHELQALKADLFVVVGFSILPQVIFEMPPRGTLNLHASLLPHYRGAAPIQWAIMNGEKVTGLTTFLIREKVDTGDLILQKKIIIGIHETYGELAARMAENGAELLLDTVALISEGKAAPKKQRGEPSLAPKIRPEHCRIDWTDGADRIVNQIRALSPEPGAFTFFKGKHCKIYKAEKQSITMELLEPGKIVEVSRDGFVVAASDAGVLIQELQLEGKKRMKSEIFLRGTRLVKDDRFKSG